MTPPVYATPDDFARLGVGGNAFAGLKTDIITAHLSAASRFADGKLQSRYMLPLLTWDDDLRQVVCDLASWTLLRRRGFNPEAPGDVAVRTGYEDARRELERVADNKGGFMVTDSTPGAARGVPRETIVTTGTQRGFSSRDDFDALEVPGGFVGD